MELYVYNPEDREVVAVITGSSNSACERVASDKFGDTDQFLWTYTPAFGATGGLIDVQGCEEIAADEPDEDEE